MSITSCFDKEQHAWFGMVLCGILQAESCTEKDPYTLPRIYDSLDALRGSQWFSTLDFLKGY